MKKLLLSVAILVGATLLLSLDKKEEVRNVSQQQVVQNQMNIPSQS